MKPHQAIFYIALLVGCGVGCVSCDKASVATSFPDELKPGEIEFLQKCALEGTSCRILILKLKDSGMTSWAADTYAFPEGDSVVAINQVVPCNDMKELYASIWTSNDAKNLKKIFSQPLKSGSYPLCSVHVDKYLGKTGKAVRYTRIFEELKSKAEDAKYAALYEFGSNVKTKVIFASSKRSPLYVESMTPGRATYEYRDGSGTSTEFTLKKNGYIGLSAYPSWKEFGDDYMRLWLKAVGSTVHKPAPTSLAPPLDELLSRFHDLKLNYSSNEKNAGAIPVFGFEQVLQNKGGDCKDLAVVMSRLLLDAGYNPQPVFLNIGSGLQPTLRQVPEPSWPDHVILYLPEKNIYIDPTLQNKSLIVDSSYVGYRNVGVNLVTGKFMLIGQ